MKQLTLFTVLTLLTGFIFAQQTISFSDYVDEKKEFKKNDQEVQTIMNSFEIKRISGFGGPTMSFTTINNDFAIVMGGGGGVLVNNFFIGGYGEGLSNTLNTGAENQLRNIEFDHGGFWLGYEIAPQKLIHPVISSRIGWGKIQGVNTKNALIIDNVFVVVPSISAEINFTRFAKVNVGVEYRQTLNVNAIEGMSNQNFSNVGAYVNFLFGWF